MKSIAELLVMRNDILVTTLAACAMSCFGLLLLLHDSNKTKTRGRFPPMPKTTLPILKSLLDAGGNVERFHDWLNEQSIEFNNRPWMFAIPGRPVTIVLTSPQTIEDALVTQSDVFLRGPTSLYMSKDVIGKTLIVSDGHSWYHQRKIAHRLFSTTLIKSAMEGTMSDNLEVLLDVANIYLKRGKSFSLKKTFDHFCMDVIGKIGFGLDLDTLRNCPDSDKNHEFVEVFDKMAVAFAVRVQSPKWLWELKRYLNIGWEKELKHNVQVLNKALGDLIMQSTKEKMEAMVKGEKLVMDNLISLVLENSVADRKNKLIEDEDVSIMRDMMLGFIFAGKDSVAHSMCWFIVWMNRYPDELRKIRDEMKEKLPGLFTGEIKVPTQDQIQCFVYLEAAIKETVRLIPSTGFIAREAMQDTTLVDGTFVQKGQTIMISSYCNARNKQNWGDDAQEFKPERMLDPDTGKLRILPSHAFSSFGSGPHVCIGKQMAIVEMKLTMATLLSKFDIKTVDDPWKLTYEFSLTIPVKGPLNVIISPLADNFAPLG